MKGKVCLVTGATSGLGKATAKKLSAMGASVIISSRDKSKGEAVLSEIRSSEGGAAASVELLQLDLSSMESVRSAAETFTAKHDSLDVLINNAGVFKSHREVTADGLETMFETNHLGPFLLTNLLLGSLKSGAPARIINISAPSTTKLDFDDLQGEKKFSALHAFGASKMGNILFTYELARRLEKTGVTCNVVHPGLMKSNLMKEANPFLRFFFSLMSSPPDRAAEKVAYYASAPELEKETGKFFRGGKPVESSEYSRDPKVQSHLWNVSVELTKLSSS